MHVQTSLITLLILQGDVVGAMRAQIRTSERQNRKVNRLLLQKLDQVRKARSSVIRDFARTKPPHAYAGKNPATAARAQDRSSRYTQFVQMSTQLMSELQNTERELLDQLEGSRRALNELWEAYAGLREAEFRTTRRVTTVR